MDDENNVSKKLSSSRENEHEDKQQSDVQKKVFREEEPCGINAKQCTMCVLLENGSPKVSDKNSAMEPIPTEEIEACYPAPGGTECAEIDRNCQDCAKTVDILKHSNGQQLPLISDKNIGEKGTHNGTTLHCYPVSGQQMCAQDVKKCHVCPLGSQTQYDQKPVPPMDTANPDSHLVLNTTSTICELQDVSHEKKKPICKACTQPLIREDQQIHSEPSEKTFQKSRVSVSESLPADNFDICRPDPGEKECDKQANVCEDCTNVTPRAQVEEGEQNIPQDISLSTKEENEEITTVDILQEQQAEDSSVLCAPAVGEKECLDDSRLCVECTDSTLAEGQQPTQEISTQASEEPVVKTSELDTHQPAEMISVLCARKGDETVCLEDYRLCVVCTETTIAQEEQTTEKQSAVDASEETAVTPSELDTQRAEEISFLCAPKDDEVACHDDSRLCVVCTGSTTDQDKQPIQEISTEDVSDEPEVPISELDAHKPAEMISVLCARKGDETVCLEDSRLCVVCTETIIAQDEQITGKLSTEDVSEETAVTPLELDKQQRAEETSFLCAPKHDEVVCHDDSRLCVVCTESTTDQDKSPILEISTEDVSDEPEVPISELDAHEPAEMISVLCARKGEETVCHEDTRLCIVCTEGTIARVHQPTEEPTTLNGAEEAVTTSKIGEQEQESDRVSVLCTREPGKETCNIEVNICDECSKDLREDGLQINVHSDASKSETLSSNPAEPGLDEISQTGSKTTFDSNTSENIQSSPNDDSDTCHPSPGDPQCDTSKGECERCNSSKKPNNGSSMGPLRGGADFPNPFADVSNVELNNFIYKHNNKTYFIPLRGGADTPGPSIDDYNDIKSPSLCFCNSNVIADTNVANPPPPPQFLDEKHSKLDYEPVKFESVTVSRGKEGKITTVASVRENQLKNMTDVEKEKLVLRDVIFEIRKISAALDNLSSQLAIETVISLRPNEEIFYAIRHGNGKILLINVSDSGQVNVNCSEDIDVRNTMSQKEVSTFNDVSSFSTNSENTQERDKNCNLFQIEKVTINNAIHMDEINTQVNHCERTDDYTNGTGHNEKDVNIIAERMINNITALAQILCNLFFQKGGIRPDIIPSKVLCPTDEGECISFECQNARCHFAAAKHNSKEKEKLCDCDDISSKKWTTQDEDKDNLEKEVRVVAEKVVNNVTNLAQLIYSTVHRKGGIAIRSEVPKELIKVETWSDNHNHERPNVTINNVEGDVRQTAQKLIDDVIKLSQLVYALVHRCGEFTARTILNQQLPAENMFNVEENIQVSKKNGKCKCESLLAVKDGSENTDKFYDLKSREGYDNIEREVKAKAEEFVNNISTLAEILYRVLCKKGQYFPGRIESKEMPQQNVEWTNHYYAGDNKNENIDCVRTAAENLVNNVTALAQLVFGVVYRYGQTFAKTINAQKPMFIEQVHECPTECNLMKNNTTPGKIQTTTINEGRITQVPVETEICECNRILSIETGDVCNKRVKESYEDNEMCCVGIHDNDERNVTAEAKKLVNNVTTLSQKLYRVLYEKGTSVIRRSTSNEAMAKRRDVKWTEINYSGEDHTSDHDRSVHDIQVVAKKLIDNVTTLAQMIYRIIYEKRMCYTINNSAPEKIPEDSRLTQLPEIIVSNGENNQNVAVSAYVPDKLFQKESRKCECRYLKLKNKQNNEEWTGINYNENQFDVDSEKYGMEGSVC